MGTVEQTLHQFAQAAEWFAKGRADLLPWHEKKLLVGQFENAIASMDKEIATCRNGEQALTDLDFALKQPAAQVPGLLDIRLQVFAKKNDPQNLVATAEAYARLAEKDDKQTYHAACAWSLACGLAQDDAKLKAEYAGKALALLRKTPTGQGHFVDSPAKLAAHLKQDKDLDPLREREDFQQFVAELEKR